MSEITEIKTLNGYPLADTAARERIAELTEEIAALKGGSDPTMSPNLCNPDTMSTGSVDIEGYHNSTSSYQCTDYIAVTPGDTLHFSTSGNSYKKGIRFVAAFDGAKNALEEKGTQNSGGVTTAVYSYDVPDGVYYVRLTFWPDVTNIMVNTGDEPLPYVPYGPIGGEEDVDNASDILHGKKWVVFGDSFTAGGYGNSSGFDPSVYQFTDGKYVGENITYPFIISERTGLGIVKCFEGGRTLANPADGSFTNSITNPTCGGYYQNTPEDADYITIYLGINDSHHESGTSGGDGEDVTGVIPLGTIDDADTSTFCGAWNVVLPWLMTNRPNAHIGIIVSNGVDRVEYRTATIAAAKKWGIPYLDLNGDERCPAMIRTVNPDISSEAKNILKQKWRVNETNQHPNVAAQRFQSTFIENWLRTI